MDTHILSNYTPELVPAYLANGLVGLRIGQYPFQRGTMFVNGFVGTSPEKASEEQAEVPWALGWDCYFDDIALSRRPEMATFERQEYDFSCGELTNHFRIDSPKGTLHAKVNTFCCRTQPTLVLQETTFTADAEVTFTFEAGVELRGFDGRMCEQARPGRDADGIVRWESRGGLTSLGIAYTTECLGASAVSRRRNDFGHEADRQITHYTITLAPGTSCNIRQLVSLVPALLHDEPHLQAYRLLAIAQFHGFDTLRTANRDAWAELWKGRVHLDTDNPAFQKTADAAFFYLHSSIHSASPCSVAPFGLAQRSLYSGHVFWDTETFMYPPALFTQPEAAKAMLDYRMRCLPRARDNARLNGFRGIQFPWQSGLTGSEVTSFYCTGGPIEHHINMDVAFAFAQYVYATGDEIFLKENAWPVLQGVAEWIVSRVTKTARGYEIHHVTGIDESRDNVNNNAFTNMAAVMVLRHAAGFAKHLGYRVPPSWTDVETGMYIPCNPQTNIIPQHDGFAYESGRCSPDTMAAFFPYYYRHEPAVMEATARYHMKHARTYLGMPMLSSVYGVWACHWNERALAREFFEHGILPYRVAPFSQFCEQSPELEHSFLGRPTTDTVFLTNPAGFLMALLMGLPRLELGAGDPTTWCSQTVILPDGWREVSVNRIFAHGEAWSLTARHGDSTRLAKAPQA